MISWGGLAGQWRWRREGVLVFVVLGLDFEDELQRFGVEPGRREDVGTALAFEEEGEPEGEGGASGWEEGGDGALLEELLAVISSGRCVYRTYSQ